MDGHKSEWKSLLSTYRDFDLPWFSIVYSQQVLIVYQKSCSQSFLDGPFRLKINISSELFVLLGFLQVGKFFFSFFGYFMSFSKISIMQVDELLAKGVSVTVYNGQVRFHFPALPLFDWFEDPLFYLYVLIRWLFYFMWPHNLSDSYRLIWFVQPRVLKLGSRNSSMHLFPT